MPVSGTSFATKAAFLLDPSAPIVIQAASAAEAERAVRGLRSVGFLELDGYVLGEGPSGWKRSASTSWRTCSRREPS